MTFPRLPLLPALAALCLSVSAGSAMARPLPIDAVAPLLADDGTAYPPAQTLPAAEVAAGGPAPGWATRAQRDQLQRLHPGRVVLLHATTREQTVQPHPAPQAWVFIEGSADVAVARARRLADAGVDKVWVVLPDPVAAPVQAAPATQGARGSRP